MARFIKSRQPDVKTVYSPGGDKWSLDPDGLYTNVEGMVATWDKLLEWYSEISDRPYIYAGLEGEKVVLSEGMNIPVGSMFRDVNTGTLFVFCGQRRFVQICLGLQAAWLSLSDVYGRSVEVEHVPRR